MSADALPPLPALPEPAYPDACLVPKSGGVTHDGWSWSQMRAHGSACATEARAPLLRRIEDMQAEIASLERELETRMDGLPESYAQALAEIARLRAERANPVAWIRRHPDGLYSDDLLPEWQIERVRKESGAWVPLYAAPQAAPAPRRLTDEQMDSTRIDAGIAASNVMWDILKIYGRAIETAVLRLNGLEQP